MTDDTTPTDGPTRTTDWPPADGSHPLADRLATHALSLETTDPTADLTDLESFADRLRDARVVGLGEATHGTREFFRLKHRLVRLLVEELDYRLFALEANFSETLAIDDYVVHGEGDPTAALDGIYFWTWDTEELLALVEWLRAFNEGRPLDDRVRFYGVDAQFTAGPAAALVDFFADRDPAVLDAHRETLETLAEEGIEVDEAPTEVAESRLAAAERLVETLDDWFERETAGDDRPVALARRHLRILEQTVESARLGREDGLEAKARQRDRAMADNLGWILDHEPHDRVAVWAHDAHLQRDARDEHWGTGTPMGAYLAERYGDDYYAVGFDFADGEFQALDASADNDLRACSLGPPPEDAATRLFASVDDPLWFLDFDAVTDDERLADYFAEPRAVRSLGAIYDPDDEHDRLHDEFRLPLAFDGLVFVAETTRAQPVERD